MSLKISVVFILTFCQKIRGSEEFYPHYGLIIKESEPTMFYDNFNKIFYTRYYINQCDQNIFKKILLGNQRCQNTTTTQTEKILDTIVKQCSHIYEMEIEELRQINNRVRRSTLSNIYNGVQLFGGISSFLINLGTSVYNYIESKSLKTNNAKLLIGQKNNKITAANIARFSVEQSFELNHMICDLSVITESEILDLYATFLIKDQVKFIENEIISFSFGTYPRTKEFLFNLLTICEGFNGNTPDFCRKVVYNNLIKIKFDGIKIDNGAIVALIKIDIPIMSNVFVNFERKDIINLGLFNNSEYAKLRVPEAIIQNNENKMFELDIKQCYKNLCPTNAIYDSLENKCLLSLISKINSENCELIISEAPLCKFIRENSGYFITAKEGLFFPTSQTSEPVIEIRNSNILIKEEGRLLCIDRKYNHNTTHNLVSPYLTSVHNSSFHMLKEIIISSTELKSKFLRKTLSKELNLQYELNRIDKNDLNQNEKLISLHNSDDHIMVKNWNINTLTVIITTSVIITVIILSLYVLLKYWSVDFKTIYHYMKNKWSEKVTKTPIQKQNTESDPHSKLDEVTILINDSKSVIYPQ